MLDSISKSSSSYPGELDARLSPDLAGLAWFWAGIGGLLPMIGGRVLSWRVSAWFWAGIGGLLPMMIGGRVLIWRVLAWFWAGIGGLLPVIGEVLLSLGRGELRLDLGLGLQALGCQRT